MLFSSALHEERGRPLRGVEACVGIDAAGLHQVIDDPRRIGNAHTSVLDERQLALRALARIGRLDDLIGNARNAQPGLELTAERAEVRNSEHARKLEQLDGRVNGVRHILYPSTSVFRFGSCWKSALIFFHMAHSSVGRLAPARPATADISRTL